jgi:hypothetical protein
MSDFLTRLAERTLGVAPVVEPSLAPAFAISAGFEEPGTDVEALEPGPGVALDGERALSRTAPSTHGATPRSVASPLVTSDAARTLGMQPSEETRIPRPALAPEGAGVVVRTIGSPAPTRTASAAQASLRSEIVTRRASDGETVVGQTGGPYREHAGPGVSDARLQPLVPSRQAPRSERLAGPGTGLTTAKPDAAPTVRITIGRVEVRAVASSERPEPKRERREVETPRLSLSEYLKRGGGR